MEARYGLSALHLACQRGNHVAVSILMQCNEVDACKEDKNGNTPLHEACRNGHVKIVNELMQHFKVSDLPNVARYANLQNSELHTPLHLACREGHKEVVNSIFMHIPDSNQRIILTQARDHEGCTPLHLACENSQKEMIHMLVSNGADLLAVKQDQVCSMHIAASYGYTEVAETLLSGHNTNVVDDFGQTPLHYAASHNKVEMIDFLISQYVFQGVLLTLGLIYIC